MALRQPTLVQTGIALIERIAADIDPGNPASEINAVLPPEVTLPLTPSEDEGSTPGDVRYLHIRFGDNGLPPDGLTILLYPTLLDTTTPFTQGEVEEYRFVIIIAWNDAGGLLTNHDLTVMLCNLTQALKKVIGHKALVGNAHAWDVLETGDAEKCLHKPSLTPIRPLAYLEDDRIPQHQVIAYSSLMWSAISPHEPI